MIQENREAELLAELTQAAIDRGDPEAARILSDAARRWLRKRPGYWHNGKFVETKAR